MTWNVRSWNRRGRARAIGASALGFGVMLALAVVSPAVASPAGTSSILFDGRVLDGSTVSPGLHLVQVEAPTGVPAVKFVLDGKYLGEATTSPYEWSVTVAGGAHKLSAHWDGGQRQRITAYFTVTGPSGGASSAAVSVGSHPKKTDPTIPPAPDPASASSPALVPGLSPSSDTVTVSTADELRGALSNARPGQTIHLSDGVYVGTFTAPVSGTPQLPITLTGSRAALLTAESITGGYGLHVTGSYWVINGFSVARSGKGIVLDGSLHTRISGVDVGFIGDEGVHFRHGSSDSSIVDSTVHDTGLKAPGFGEGIYIGSAHSNWGSVMGSSSTPDRTDRVVVMGNHLVNTSAEGVDVKEGTTGGSVLSNVFTNAGYSGANFADSWVDVKGNGYLIEGNRGSAARSDAFQVHQALVGWGLGNDFLMNGPVSAVPGYLVDDTTRSGGTFVQCQPTTAGRGLSNLRCSN